MTNVDETLSGRRPHPAGREETFLTLYEADLSMAPRVHPDGEQGNFF